MYQHVTSYTKNRKNQNCTKSIHSCHSSMLPSKWGQVVSPCFTEKKKRRSHLIAFRKSEIWWPDCIRQIRDKDILQNKHIKPWNRCRSRIKIFWPELQWGFNKRTERYPIKHHLGIPSCCLTNSLKLFWIDREGTQNEWHGEVTLCNFNFSISKPWCKPAHKIGSMPKVEPRMKLLTCRPLTCTSRDGTLLFMSSQGFATWAVYWKSLLRARIQHSDILLFVQLWNLLT